MGYDGPERRREEPRELSDFLLDHILAITVFIIIALVAIGGYLISKTISGKASEGELATVKVEGSPCRTAFRAARINGLPAHQAADKSAHNYQCFIQGMLNRNAICVHFSNLNNDRICKDIDHFFNSFPRGGGAHSPTTGNQLPEGMSPPLQIAD